MPTNANTFNSRVTSEALEAKFRQTFPSQGGAELVQDLFASGVIVPTVDFTSVAEGSALRSDLQQAWDFSTGTVQITNLSYVTIVNTPGFWLVDLSYTGFITTASRNSAIIRINDGATQKNVWGFTSATSTASTGAVLEDKFVVFLRSGDTLEGKAQGSSSSFDIWYRQIADVYGNLTQPLGYSPQ